MACSAAVDMGIEILPATSALLCSVVSNSKHTTHGCCWHPHASASACNSHAPPKAWHSCALRLAALLVRGRQASRHSRPHKHLCSVLILAITPDKGRWQAVGLLVATQLREEHALCARRPARQHLSGGKTQNSKRPNRAAGLATTSTRRTSAAHRTLGERRCACARSPASAWSAARVSLQCRSSRQWRPALNGALWASPARAHESRAQRSGWASATSARGHSSHWSQEGQGVFLCSTSIVGKTPSGFFHTGVRRRKYKLGQTKQNPSNVFLWPRGSFGYGAMRFKSSQSDWII